MSGRWCPMGRFKEMSHALNWVVQYDTEGTVEMKIKDNELRRYIPLDEAFGMMPKKLSKIKIQTGNRKVSDGSNDCYRR